MRKYICEGEVACYCDKCKHYVTELFEWEGDELCEDCFYTATDDMAICCDECGDVEFLHYYEGKKLCLHCFRDKFKIDVDSEEEVDDSPDPLDVARAWAVDHM